MNKKEITNYRKNTHHHIELVRKHMESAQLLLTAQATAHDLSKFSPEEETIYAEVVPQFKGLKYGSPQYKEVSAKLGPAWEHHVEHNPHHPEHWENGVEDMDLLYILEMLCDWKAASEREGDFSRSFEVALYKYIKSPELRNILRNTAERLDMYENE